MEQKKGALAKLRNTLYSRNKVQRQQVRHSLHSRYYGSAEDWKDEKIEGGEAPPPSRQRTPALSLFFAASVVFFVLSVVAAAVLFLSGSAEVSDENIDIKISGPVAIPGGKELALQVTIKNNNPVALELADLLVEYPEGTRDSGDVSALLPRHRESIGTIKPGEEVRRTIRSILFGEENDPKDIAISIEYRIEASNAIFFKEEGYRVVISSAPLTILFDGPEEVVSGQEVTFDIEVVSNSTALMQNVLLVAEYPFGYELVASDPVAAFDTSVWRLGDIPPGGKRSVRLRGVVIGQDGEERIFRFHSGIASTKEDGDVTAALGAYTAALAIKQPFISLNLALDGNTSEEYVVQAGKQIRADVEWINNLPTQVFDAELVIVLDGNFFDKSSVNVNKGFYDSRSNTIRFSKETLPDLAELAPGQDGRASFSFETLGISSGIVLDEPEIKLSASVKGRRISETNVPEAIESTLTRRIQLATDLLLSSRTVYTVGPFANTGPIPPKVETETTYTVIWTLTNSSSAVSGTQVTATLPSYVRWMNVVEPSTEEVSFNPVGGVVTWRAGDVSAHTGSVSAPREVAFQITLVPSISQVDKSIALVGEQRVFATDRFTKAQVGGMGRILTTLLSTDPNVAKLHEKVVP
jgi:hypothetical protein